MATSTTVALGEHAILRIGLGTNRLTESPEHVRFVREAVAAGVQMIDTAHIYAGGESERTIGAALAPAPEGCVVATKGGFSGAEAAPQALRAQIEESLRRLRREQIDLYYLHRLHDEVPIEESIGVLEEYRSKGAIRHIGLSEVSIEQIERARALTSIAAVQSHYNLSERRHEAVVDHCAAEGIVFVPYYPLRGAHSPALAQIASRHGARPAQIALAWLLARSPAMLPIPGTLSLSHLRENLGALQIELSEEELQALS
ncbi:MAG TPA: aldo/keto reductase [Solirubrobacteraceae bacterium]|nr:aldo/keto reductase [Solirubrobacteraceae bacterium]